MGKIGLICISNTRRYFLVLDPRITSRLSFKSVLFPPYSNEELYTILKQRANRAFYPNACSRQILELISDLVANDARVAIQTLRNAAYVAEQRNRRKITSKDVEKAYEEAKKIKKKIHDRKAGRTL